ncbi:MAG TPA: Gfo/Idh/MocA family oxidoreductase [Vicinamibacterales bacterium]|jgi:predicted dehydrogenase|nr:Gfo/Idh/MocA family oxidoreductase [Vicinamibacterales bacterium]
MPYRAAVIGCGRIGSEFGADVRAPGVYSHAGAYSACESTELAAVCDVDSARARRCATRWKTVPYADVARMLAEVQPQIVSVCTPDATHFEIVRMVLSTTGVCGVLAEKPLATQTADARVLRDLARARSIALAVNYVRRYSPTHVALRDDIARGAFGSIQTVSGLYVNGVVHNGSHWFDLARFLVGEIAEVWGVDIRGDAASDPTVDAVMRFKGGAGGHLQGCDGSAYSVFEMDIVGTAGRVRIVESGHRVEFQHVVDSQHYGGYKTLAVRRQVEGDMHDLTLRAVEDLVAALEAKRAPRCTADDAVAALEIGCAVREAARTGRSVTLAAQC